VQREITKWLAIGVALLIAVAAFVRSGSGPTTSSQASVMNQVQKRGTVVVGVTSEVAPFGFIDPTSHELVGFDIDVAHLIAKGLFNDPNKIQLKKIAFSARWTAVSNGDVDFGIMDTTVFPSRLDLVNFTAYIRSGLAVLGRSDVGANTLADLNNSKYTIAIQDDPSEKQALATYLPKAKTLILSTEADMLTAVQSGRAAAEVIDLPVAAWRAINSKGEMKNFGNIAGTQTQNAIFLRQGDFQWWYFLNSMVQEMRCGSLYADFAAIYKKWFGIVPPAPDTCMAFSLPDLQAAVNGG
jgi:polar amino acid transport system substrate-binding protein